jgi:hypothetical protein
MQARDNVLDTNITAVSQKRQCHSPVWSSCRLPVGSQGCHPLAQITPGQGTRPPLCRRKSAIAPVPCAANTWGGGGWYDVFDVIIAAPPFYAVAGEDHGYSLEATKSGNLPGNYPR